MLRKINYGFACNKCPLREICDYDYEDNIIHNSIIHKGEHRTIVECLVKDRGLGKIVNIKYEVNYYDEDN